MTNLKFHLLISLVVVSACEGLCQSPVFISGGPGNVHGDAVSAVLSKPFQVEIPEGSNTIILKQDHRPIKRESIFFTKGQKVDFQTSAGANKEVRFFVLKDHNASSSGTPLHVVKGAKKSAAAKVEDLTLMRQSDPFTIMAFTLPNSEKRAGLDSAINDYNKIVVTVNTEAAKRKKKVGLDDKGWIEFIYAKQAALEEAFEKVVFAASMFETEKLGFIKIYEPEAKNHDSRFNLLKTFVELEPATAPAPSQGSVSIAFPDSDDVSVVIELVDTSDKDAAVVLSVERIHFSRLREAEFTSLTGSVGVFNSVLGQREFNKQPVLDAGGNQIIRDGKPVSRIYQSLKQGRVDTKISASYSAFFSDRTSNGLVGWMLGEKSSLGKVRVGLSVAGAVGTEESGSIYFGPVIEFGRKQNFSIVFGQEFRQVKRLAPYYKVGEEFVGTGDIPIENVWRNGWFIGVTFKI